MPAPCDQQTAQAAPPQVQLRLQDAQVQSNKRLTGDLWQLVVNAPAIAQTVQPGQFVHVLLNDKPQHILRRPLSVHGVLPAAGGGTQAEQLSLLYQVVGAGTLSLTTCKPGDFLSLLGPVGNGWHVPLKARRILLVGGGVGLAPLTMLAEAEERRGTEVHALIGARNEDYLLMLSCGLAAGCIRHFATDDGSMGYHGFNTDLLDGLFDELGFDYVATCGPEPMQRIVAGKAAARGIACEVSLERRMACGLGACLSCVVDTVGGKKRACVDGPVFDAREVCW